MAPTFFTRAVLLALSLTTAITAQAQSTPSSEDGYIGWKLEQRGSTDDVLYETESTNTNVSTSVPEPDVFLNASLHVGEIDLLVSNLTAKINLEAQVLSLLDFNAGVKASIDRVTLSIQNVTAKVVLEARLSNLVTMIGDVLDSLDLNPILATLGTDLTSITNATTDALTGATGSSSSSNDTLSKRGINDNVLYAVNDYQGNTHTNRILRANGDIVDESIDNNGHIYADKVVGTYASLMTFNGYNVTVNRYGHSLQESEYTYAPFLGLNIVAAIFMNTAGDVVDAQVLAESRVGGSSQIE